MPHARQLADVQLPAPSHLRSPRVADVRVVLPDDQLGGAAVSLEMSDQRVERVAHVHVAQIPRGHLVGEHRAVVLLGVCDQTGVLLGVELIILGGQAVSPQVPDRVAMQFQQLLDHTAAAGLADAERHGPPIVLGFAAEVLKAGVPPPRPGRALLVDLVEIGDDLVDREVEAVEIEPVEADAVVRRTAVVVLPQPADEVEHLGVAPHPGGK